MKKYNVELIRKSKINLNINANNEDEVLDILDEFLEENDLDEVYNNIDYEDNYDVNIDENHIKTIEELEEYLKNNVENNTTYCEKCGRNL